MGKTSNPDLKRLLPAVALATFYVALAPIAIVWALETAGVLSSTLISIAAVLVLSFGVSALGAAWWRKRPGSADVLFGDLMVWGWIRRWRTERRLSEATTLLGAQEGKVSRERQTELLEELASALEARDPYTAGHSRRVARFSVLIAKGMGLPHEMVARVRTAAAIHDVGKINTPRAILNKPGKLTDEEFEIVKRHAEDSALMVSALGEEITAIVRHHHERLDGTGYPSRIAGDAVPLGSRIIAVADTFDALTSNRAYRNAKSHKAAMDILSKEAGTQLDPAAVRAFLNGYSGRRALGLWNGVTIVPERLLSWLSTGLGGAASTAKLATAAAVTALLGAPVLTSSVTGASANQGSSSAAAEVVKASSQSGNVPGLSRLGGVATGLGGQQSIGTPSSGGSQPQGGSTTGSAPGQSKGSGAGPSSGGGSPSGGGSSGSGSGTGGGGPLPGTGGGGPLPGTGGGGPLPGTGGGGPLPNLGGTVTNTVGGVTTTLGGVTKTAGGVVSTVTGAVTNTAGGTVNNVTGTVSKVTGGVLPKAGGAVSGVLGGLGGKLKK